MRYGTAPYHREKVSNMAPQQGNSNRDAPEDQKRGWDLKGSLPHTDAIVLLPINRRRYQLWRNMFFRRFLKKMMMVIM